MKAARGPALEAELAYAEARLAELSRAVDDAAAAGPAASSNCVVAADGIDGFGGAASEFSVQDGAGCDAASRSGIGATARGDGVPSERGAESSVHGESEADVAEDATVEDAADAEAAAPPPPSPDEIFRAAFLTTLRRDLKLPVLALSLIHI